MLVTHLKQTELSVDDWEFTRLIPNLCMFCGKPLVMTVANTGLSCSDEFCPTKVARRCAEFLKDVRFTGIGYSQMLDFCQNFELTSSLQLFMLESSDLEGYLDGSAVQKNFFRLIEYLQNYRTMTLKQALVYAKMPSIQDSTAEALSKGFDSFDIFMNTVELENVDFIQEQLGIKEESSLRSIKIYEQLMLNDNVLREVIDEGFIIISQPKVVGEEVILVISDSAGADWKSKADFQDYVINKFSDRFNIVFKSSVTKKTSILIAEQGTQTSKVTKAERFGIPIMSGTEFIVHANNSDYEHLINP